MDEETLAVEPFKRDENERFGVKSPPKGKRRCIVVVPEAAGARQTVVLAGVLLGPRAPDRSRAAARGFHIAFITPDPDKTWDAWYAYLTEKHGLSKKPAFIGMSKGGVNEYDWASVNPDKVSCIYADNPAIRPGSLRQARRAGPARRPSAEHLRKSRLSCWTRHTLAIESRYRQLGGRITVMIKEGAAHHPHSLRNPKPIADWIEKNVRPGRRSTRFRRRDVHQVVVLQLCRIVQKAQGREDLRTSAAGPGFTECYDRYDATTKSQWGITGMAVIVPQTVGAGKPWVFRADRIGPDSAAVDLALLAKGFHIVDRPRSSRNQARSANSGTPSTSCSPTTAFPRSP